jgi:hypothetical protein
VLKGNGRDPNVIFGDGMSLHAKGIFDFPVKVSRACVATQHNIALGKVIYAGKILFGTC